MAGVAHATDPANPENPAAADSTLEAYFRCSAGPLHCAALILPLVVLFELARWTQAAGVGAPQLVAERLIEATLAAFGPVGQVAPALALGASLVLWWRFRAGPERLRPAVLAGMVAESLLLATPLFVLHRLFGAAVGGQPWLYALGAGVYEEFAFRWLLLGGVWLGLRQFPAVRPPAAIAISIGVSAVAFALSHFTPVGNDALTADAFWLRALAGVYLGVVYVGRGFGLAVGAHVAFNLIGALAG